MTKTELVERVAARTGFTKKDSAKAVDAVLDTVTEALAAGEKVTLVGFGSFELTAESSQNRARSEDRSSNPYRSQKGSCVQSRQILERGS